MKNNEVKVSVLFKPSRKSKINSDLTYLGYYWYTYDEFMSKPIDTIKNSNKIKIEWVKYEDLWELYDYVRINIKKWVVIIICSISELFE